MGHATVSRSVGANCNGALESFWLLSFIFHLFFTMVDKLCISSLRNLRRVDHRIQTCFRGFKLEGVPQNCFHFPKSHVAFCIAPEIRRASLLASRDRNFQQRDDQQGILFQPVSWGKGAKHSGLSKKSHEHGDEHAENFYLD